MRMLLAVTLLALAGGCPIASAQPADAQPASTKPASTAPAADLPSGESLFAKHVEAVGGLEALKAQKSAKITARIARPGMPSGILTIWRKAPNSMYKIIDFPGAVTIETWCDGENAWMRDTNHGVAKLSGEALAETKLESNFVGEADFKARYKSLRTKERTQFNSRPAYSVAATTSSGKDRTLYFDAEKGFLIGVLLMIPGQHGEEPLTISFNDYKQYGPTWQPTVVVEDAGKMKTTTTFTQIDMDLATMPSIEPPAEIKNLK